MGALKPIFDWDTPSSYTAVLPPVQAHTLNREITPVNKDNIGTNMATFAPKHYYLPFLAMPSCLGHKQNCHVHIKRNGFKSVLYLYI